MSKHKHSHNKHKVTPPMVEAVVVSMHEAGWLPPDFFQTEKECKCGKAKGHSEEFRRQTKKEIKGFIQEALKFVE